MSDDDYTLPPKDRRPWDLEIKTVQQCTRCGKWWPEDPKHPGYAAIHECGVVERFKHTRELAELPLGTVIRSVADVFTGGAVPGRAYALRMPGKSAQGFSNWALFSTSQWVDAYDLLGIYGTWELVK